MILVNSEKSICPSWLVSKTAISPAKTVSEASSEPALRISSQKVLKVDFILSSGMLPVP